MALWEYFTENKFTDMVLITRDRRINAHSAILTQFCPFLSGLIKNHFLTFEEVILSIPDIFGDELSESLYSVYSGENYERFSILLESEPSSSNNEWGTDRKLQQCLEKHLEGVPLKVVLKNESDLEDDIDGIVDGPKLNKGSSAETSVTHYQPLDGSGDTEVHEMENFTDFISPVSENIDIDYSYSNSSLDNEISTSVVYKCDPTFPEKGTCLEAFTSTELLDKPGKTVQKESLKRISPGLKYQCEECGKHISSPECLRLHVDAIHRGIKHPCPHCNYSTGWPKNLDEHIMFYHTHANDESILKYQCSICGKKFKRQNSLAEHELTHNPKTFKCTHCKRGFSHGRYLERHMSSVHGDKKFPCENCGKKFTTQEYVKTHYNSVHLDHSERRHKCEICGQGFNKKMAYRSHMNKHQGLKPFLCPAPECDKCFSDDTAWSHHKRNCSFIRVAKIPATSP